MTELPTKVLDQLVAKAGRLYSLPTVAMRVLELTEDPQVDNRALKECIENDPALTTKVLRVVNSSLFGLSREVSDLNQALALLGTKPLKLLVLGFSLPAGLYAGMTGEMLGRYWRHTLTKAVAAREISETVWHQPGDEGFLAGLLQDLGMLVLIQQLGAPYVEFLEKVSARGSDLFALEAESIGFDHTVLSARLLASWRLPDALVEAALWETSQHAAESPPLGQRPTLAEILRLAEWIARLLADGRSDALEHLLALAEQRHGLSAKQLENLIGTLEDKVRQLADVLSLQLPQGLDYRDVLVQAHQRLAEVADEAARDLVFHRGFQPPDAEERRAWPEVARRLPNAEDQGLLEHARSLSEAVSQVSRSGADWAGVAGGQRADRELAASETLAMAPAAVLHARPAMIAADSGLLAQLTRAVTRCRQLRCALSLLLVSLNDVEELVITRGVEGFGKLRQFLAATCRGLDHPRLTCLPQGEAGFALILPECDRGSAVQFGNQLIDRMRRPAALGAPEGRPTVGISVGVASVSLPPKNFPPKDLLDAAGRCLYGSYVSGGVVKSLEIY